MMRRITLDAGEVKKVGVGKKRIRKTENPKQKHQNFKLLPLFSVPLLMTLVSLDLTLWASRLMAKTITEPTAKPNRNLQSQLPILPPPPLVDEKKSVGNGESGVGRGELGVGNREYPNYPQTSIPIPVIPPPNNNSNPAIGIPNANPSAQMPSFPPINPTNREAGLGNQQTPTSNSQFPNIPPANVPNPDFPPIDTYDLRNPLPPLGYPEQSTQLASPEQFSRYFLGVGDSIGVTVERFTDLNFQATIDLQGNIIVPLVGKLKILGMTPEGVQELLQEKFNEFVVNPKVTVVLAGLRPANVTITGEVVRPGYYSIGPGAQLTSALQAAGGTTNLADLRTIVVRRRSPLDNTILQQQVDLFTPLQNSSDLPNVTLRDGDAVVVLKLETGTLTDYDQTLASRSTLAQPTITIRVLNYPGGGIGNLSLPNGSTFIDALTSLAPSLEDANLREIAVMRFDPEQGKVVTQEINGKRVLLGDVSQNIPLQDEDVIVVGRSLIAKVGYALSFITRPFSDFLGFRSFFNNLGNVFGGNNTTNNP